MVYFIAPTEWKSYLAKGNWFYTKFKLTAKQIEQELSQSTWKQPADLVKYGWRTDQICKDAQPGPPVFKDLPVPKLDPDEAEWTSREVQHRLTLAFNVTHFSRNYQDRVMISTHMYSPQYSAIGKGDVPRLNHWSDVVFLTYYQTILDENLYNIGHTLKPEGGSQIPCPQWWLIHQIGANPGISAPDIMEHLAKQRGAKELGVWPGALFELESEENSRAMLATDHGKGLSFFLLQHKEQFGLKRVKGVRIWVSKNGPGEPLWKKYHAAFEIA
ncbi:hypothetical protein EJ08DRAFT_734983 [Tothia fuscella]|uniref:Uncharacterized protein n=1 Tax=Tothia fuscella TaxID=1048955 RepID=A0A9P4NPR6_9PEZI|nr:hypothetical protein EJ08DRAFT_734983 [Tothia fuscella]